MYMNIPNNTKDVPDFIAKLIKKSGLTQENFCKKLKLDIGRSTLANYKRHNAILPSLEVWFKLCNFAKKL